MSRESEKFTQQELSRIVEMAWEDRTPFEAIKINFAIDESDVIAIMRRQMKTRSFKLWRARVSNRKTKHLALRPAGVSRGYCPTQYKQR
ncbi:MAG TPA: TIGR03643 family protein [Porticoccaceae bacterium]|nr:TIGR03643 family protein [Porticoccaceae bacterium]